MKKGIKYLDDWAERPSTCLYDCTLRYLWRGDVATELYYSNSDNQIWGASVRLNRFSQTIKWLINKHYPFWIVENESMGHEMKKISRRPRKEAASMGKVKFRYGHRRGYVCHQTWLRYWKSFFNILSGKYVTRNIYYIRHFFCLNKNDILIGESRLIRPFPQCFLSFIVKFC